MSVSDDVQCLRSRQGRCRTMLHPKFSSLVFFSRTLLLHCFLGFLCFGSSSVELVNAQTLREFTLNIGVITHPLVNERGVERNAPYLVVNGDINGPAIHVQRGDEVAIHVVNGLTEGVTFHWHGLEMHGYNHYDGVIYVTQCGLAPNSTYTYRFMVNEIPGTYWYHSHHLLQSYGENFMKGPLIIHPRDTPHTLVNQLAASFKGLDAHQWGNEHILFTSDFWKYTELGNAMRFEEPIGKAENGMGVSHDWWGVLVNGDSRPVIYVPAGQTSTLRVINGGFQDPFRFQIDGFPLRIVASDGSPTEPFVADAIDLHSAERTQVELDVPADMPEGSTFWIRMRGLEDERYYNYSMNAILFVGSKPVGGDSAIADPITQRKPTLESKIVNCYTHTHANCLPLTVLKASASTIVDYGGLHPPVSYGPTEFHTIDSDFLLPPQFSHFISIDSGAFHQYETPDMPFIAPYFQESHLHPSSNSLTVELNKTLILVLRSKTKFIHPMHLHGHRFEVLEVYTPEMEDVCTLTRCELPDYFDSEDKRAELAAMPKGSVFKDTVVMPGGGAVALRFTTDNPGAWFGHCHIALHMHDGMAWSMLEGNYTTPWEKLPADYPECRDDKPNLGQVFMGAQHPSCQCFEYQDFLLDNEVTKDYHCSRDASCYFTLHGNDTERAKTTTYETGIKMHKPYAVRGYVISVIISLLIIAVSMAVSQQYATQKGNGKENTAMATESSSAPVPPGWLTKFIADLKLVYWQQFAFGLKNSVTSYRVVEVIGLAYIAGFAFFEVGSGTSMRSLRESISLLFFSLTLWTFGRMYVAVVSYSRYSARLLRENNQHRLAASVLGRVAVDFSVEFWWALLYAAMVFPIAQMAGMPGVWFQHGVFLGLNCMSYIALGAVLGSSMSSVPLAMSTATLLSQTSLLCAGFFTSLPAGLAWVRNISPMWYTFTGMVRGHYRWQDSYECIAGDVELGQHQCFLEFSTAIDTLKYRGVNVATSYRADSDDVGFNIVMLLVLISALYLGVYLALRFAFLLGRHQQYAQVPPVEVLPPVDVQEEKEEKEKTNSKNKQKSESPGKAAPTGSAVLTKAVTPITLLSLLCVALVTPPSSLVMAQPTTTEFAYTLNLGIGYVAFVDDHQDYRTTSFHIVNNITTSPVIHVPAGSTLAVTVVNNMVEGVTIHWHGLQMKGYNELDGVRDVTQCQIVPKKSFTYRFVVNDIPGTYFYHTESRLLDGGQDWIRGPIIVHPKDTPASVIHQLQAQHPADQYAWGNERVLIAREFEQYADAIYQEPLRFENPIPRTKNKMGVSHNWWSAWLNGVERKVVYVSPGETFKLRMINANYLFPFRLSIDTFPLRIVASDGSPTLPFVTDAVDLYAGERFDVEFDVPADVQEGSRYWIRMRGLEDEALAYNYTFNAILYVGSPPLGGDAAVADPSSTRKDPALTKVVNCYVEFEHSDLCLPLTVLRAAPAALAAIGTPSKTADFHTADFEVMPFRPFIGHFIALDDGLFVNFASPYRPPILPAFNKTKDSHPHTNVLHIKEGATVIMFLLSTTKFLHPMHFHGQRFEVLEVYMPHTFDKCGAINCKRPDVFDSKEKRAELAAMPKGSVLKDTATLPGGGALAIRFIADNKGLWLAGCNILVHKEEGMQFLIQIGDDVTVPASKLPADFPDCEDKDRVEKNAEEPACTCFDAQEDHIFQLRMTERYRCSRTALCYQADGNRTARAAAGTKHEAGIRMHRAYSTRGWIISLFCVVAILSVAVAINLLFNKGYFRACRHHTLKQAVAAGASRTRGSSVAARGDSFFADVRASYWYELPFTSKGAINTYRVVEVVGLAIITGFIFFEVGRRNTSKALEESMSLLFFGLTLWTFTRMYVSIVQYENFASRIFSTQTDNGAGPPRRLAAQVLGRALVDLSVEFWWPLIFTLIAFPTAQINAMPGIWFQHGIFLALNNMCYVALGAVLGVLSPSIPVAISGATLFSQMSIVCAGFYTSLPKAIAWIRFISPVWYAYTGMVRGHLKWSDTYSCPYGDMDAGINQCFVETNGLVNDMKFRGINVATAYKSDCDNVGGNILMLVLLMATMYFMIWAGLRYALWTGRTGYNPDIKYTENARRNSLMPSVLGNEAITFEVRRLQKNQKSMIDEEEKEERESMMAEADVLATPAPAASSSVPSITE